MVFGISGVLRSKKECIRAWTHRSTRFGSTEWHLSSTALTCPSVPEILPSLLLKCWTQCLCTACSADRHSIPRCSASARRVGRISFARRHMEIRWTASRPSRYWLPAWCSQGYLIQPCQRSWPRWHSSCQDNQCSLSWILLLADWSLSASQISLLQRNWIWTE